MESLLRELYVEICYYLDNRSVINLSYTCRQLRKNLSYVLGERRVLVNKLNTNSKSNDIILADEEKVMNRIKEISLNEDELKLSIKIHIRTFQRMYSQLSMVFIPKLKLVTSRRYIREYLHIKGFTVKEINLILRFYMIDTYNYISRKQEFINVYGDMENDPTMGIFDNFVDQVINNPRSCYQ